MLLLLFVCLAFWTVYDYKMALSRTLTTTAYKITNLPIFWRDELPHTHMLDRWMDGRIDTPDLVKVRKANSSNIHWTRGWMSVGTARLSQLRGIRLVFENVSQNGQKINWCFASTNSLHFGLRACMYAMHVRIIFYDINTAQVHHSNLVTVNSISNLLFNSLKFIYANRWIQMHVTYTTPWLKYNENFCFDRHECETIIAICSWLFQMH